MSSRKEHTRAGIIIGGIAGGCINFFKQQNEIRNGERSHFDLLEFLVYTVGGAVFGSFAANIPDRIEPAFTKNNGKFKWDKNHRGPFHSVTAGVVVVTASYSLLKYGKIDNYPLEAVIALFAAGYVSHLGMDALKGGIPFWIIKK